MNAIFLYNVLITYAKERRGRDREERPEVSSDGKSILMQGEDGELVCWRCSQLVDILKCQNLLIFVSHVKSIIMQREEVEVVWFHIFPASLISLFLAQRGDMEVAIWLNLRQCFNNILKTVRWDVRSCRQRPRNHSGKWEITFESNICESWCYPSNRSPCQLSRNLFQYCQQALLSC